MFGIGIVARGDLKEGEKRMTRMWREMSREGRLTRRWRGKRKEGRVAWRRRRMYCIGVVAREREKERERIEWRC